MRESRAFRRIIVLLLLAIVIVAQTYTFWYFGIPIIVRE